MIELIYLQPGEEMPEMSDDEPWLIVGAPGGSVIISAVRTTIINAIDFGMSAVEAVSFPRIHCEGGPVFCEARVQGDVVDDAGRLCGALNSHDLMRAKVI